MKPNSLFFPEVSLRPVVSENWIACSYDLFSQEGPNGIRIERLARILKLNKSGFYHYFDGFDDLSRQLVDYHYRMVDIFLKEVAACENLDPDYLHVLVKHNIVVKAQIQLVRNKTHHRFLNAHSVVDDKIARALVSLWIDYTQINQSIDVAYDYCCLVRDMMYTRIGLTNFVTDHIRSIMGESRAIVRQMSLKPVPSRRLKYGTHQYPLKVRV